VAGKFDEAKALALIAKHFGAIPRPARVLPPFWTVEPTQDGDRLFTVRRKGDIQILVMAYHIPSNLHEDSDPLGFSSNILAQVPTGRLHKAIVEKGLATQVFGYPLVGIDPGLQMFGAVVAKGRPIEPVKDEMARIVEGFGADPPTEEEMARTRTAFRNESEKALANHDQIDFGRPGFHHVPHTGGERPAAQSNQDGVERRRGARQFQGWSPRPAGRFYCPGQSAASGSPAPTLAGDEGLPRPEASAGAERSIPPGEHRRAQTSASAPSRWPFSRRRTGAKR
jgi:hypothetical protein